MAMTRRVGIAAALKSAPALGMARPKKGNAMYRTILALTAAAPLAFAAVPSMAMPAGAPAVAAAPQVILVAGGCGLGYHRGPYGGCRPNGVFGGPVIVGRRCPPGYHLGPYGRACRPNL